jgi:hypothetical protein
MKGIQNYFKSPFFVSMATAAKFVQPAMIIFVFFNFLAFWPFPWQRQPF